MMGDTDDLPAVWHLETLRPPCDYPEHQILFACAVARALGRGKFVLCETPNR